MVQRVDVSHRSMFSFVHKNNAKSSVFGQEEFVLASFLKTRLSILKIPLGLKSLNLSGARTPVGRQNLFDARPLILQTDDRRLVSPC